VPRKSLLYFGPSNNTGPGSVWRKQAEGGYALRFDLVKAIPDENKRALLVTKGTSSSCSGSTLSDLNLNVGLMVSSTVSSVNGNLTAALGMASKSEVTARAWRLDLINEFDYERWLASDEASDFRKDIVDGEKWKSRRIMNAAVAVEGFTAVLTFNSGAQAEVKAAFPNESTPINGNITAKWTESNTLAVVTEGEFYIAGRLVKVNADGGFGMLGVDQPGGGIFGEIEAVPEGTKSVSDPL